MCVCVCVCEYMCVYVCVKFSTIWSFRHSLKVLDHIPEDKGGLLFNQFITKSVLHGMAGVSLLKCRFGACAQM